jgi:hypothetical protein
MFAADSLRDGAADALDEASGNQHRRVEGQSAKQRSACEDGEPDQEDAFAAEQVAQPTGKKQEAAKGDEVGIDHPREPGLRIAEVTLDRWQRDVHDRHVDDDQQESCAEDHEREPARVLHICLDDPAQENSSVEAVIAWPISFQSRFGLNQR